MLKRMKIFDLTHKLYYNMPSYPMLPQFKIDFFKIAARDKTTVSIVTSMHTHLGTHIDFPSHVIPGSKSIDDYLLQDLSGEGVVLDLSYKKEGEEITKGDLVIYEDYIEENKMLFLYTGWSQKRALTPTYLFKWPYVGADAAKFIVKKNIRILGIDGLSIGGWSGNVPAQGPISKTDSNTVHKILLNAGTLLVEEVANLDKVLNGKKVSTSFFVIAPLSLKGVEASPCRVLAIQFEDLK